MISIKVGDITQIQTHAIVNSAHPSLLAGGGVCGAIHEVAGPSLEDACRKLAPLQAGQAVITPAYNLPAQFVIHAVAPIYIDGTKQEEDKLSSTYISICRLIRSYSITSISIPSIATGIYRFPISLASKIAIATLKKNLDTKCHATFVCFDDQTFHAYQSSLEC